MKRYLCFSLMLIVLLESYVAYASTRRVDCFGIRIMVTRNRLLSIFNCSSKTVNMVKVHRFYLHAASLFGVSIGELQSWQQPVIFIVDKLSDSSLLPYGICARSGAVIALPSSSFITHELIHILCNRFTIKARSFYVNRFLGRTFWYGGWDEYLAWKVTGYFYGTNDLL